MARVVTGNLAALGPSNAFTAPRPTLAEMGAFNVSMWGTFVATLQLERSFDQGATWLPLTALGSPITFTGPCSEPFEEPEDGVQYRLNCTAYTSGTVNYRMSS